MVSLNKTIINQNLPSCLVLVNKESKKQHSHEKVSQQLNGDIDVPLIKIKENVVKNVRNRRDISDEILN